jgi:chromosome segregation ATPase
MSQSTDQRALSAAASEIHVKDPFSVLEQRVEALVDRHREALARIEDLRLQLRARDDQVAELNRQLAALQRLRGEVLRRVEGLMGRVAELEKAAARAPLGDGKAELIEPEARA